MSNREQPFSFRVAWSPCATLCAFMYAHTHAFCARVHGVIQLTCVCTCIPTARSGMIRDECDKTGPHHRCTARRITVGGWISYLGTTDVLITSTSSPRLLALRDHEPPLNLVARKWVSSWSRKSTTCSASSQDVSNSRFIRSQSRKIYEWKEGREGKGIARAMSRSNMKGNQDDIFPIHHFIQHVEHWKW